MSIIAKRIWVYIMYVVSRADILYVLLLSNYYIGTIYLSGVILVQVELTRRASFS